MLALLTVTVATNSDCDETMGGYCFVNQEGQLLLSQNVVGPYCVAHVMCPVPVTGWELSSVEVRFALC